MSLFDELSSFGADRLSPPGLAVLSYHAVGHWVDRPRSGVSELLFRRHLLAVERAGSMPVSTLGLLAGDLLGGAGDVLVAFEEGYESVLTVAAEQLGNSGLNGLVFVSTQMLGRPGYLSEDQVRLLLGMGLVVGSKGVEVGCLSGLALGELRRQLRDSRQRLESLVRYPVRFVCLPSGRVDSRLIEEAQRAGYRRVLGSQPGLVATSGPVPHELRRFCVTEQTSPERVEELCLGRGKAVAAAMLRHRLADAPRLLLGDDGFEAARSTLSVIRRSLKRG